MISASTLSQAPQKIFLSAHQQYDTTKQTRFCDGENNELNLTMNGTQTFLPNGTPYDADNDR